MVMLLVSMTGRAKTLPRSGFVQQVIPKDKKQLVFAPASLILTNYFLPLNEALGFRSSNGITSAISFQGIR